MSGDGARKTFGCDGKVDYGSWAAAARVAKRARRKGRAAGVILAPYHCTICGGFHLYSADQLQRRQEKRRKGKKVWL